MSLEQDSSTTCEQVALARCPSCGHENPPGVESCGGCGRSLAADRATERKPHCSLACLSAVAVIVVVTFVAFVPTLFNGFVYWDDDVTLLGNPNYQALWPGNLRWMFSTTHTGAYQPLAWVSLALDYQIWGHERPGGYHLTSLLLHIGGALVFFFVSLRLLRAALRVPEGEADLPLTLSAAVAALVYAVHPLRVESVAWATERRDVLSGLFVFLTLLSYLRARTPLPDGSEQKGRSLAWTFVLFVLAMLSKGTTVVLPVVMLILDFYPLRRLGGGPRNWFTRRTREVWIEKVPFLVAAVVAGVVAVRGQQEAGALASLAERDVAARIAVAFYGPAFYLYKTIVPFGLSPVYEWPIRFSPLNLPFLLSGVVVIAITVCVIRFYRYWPPGLFLWLVYLTVLAPLLLPFQLGTNLAADRNTYLSCTVWAVLAGVAVAYCWLRRGSGVGTAVTVLAGALVVGLAWLTAAQCRVWRDTEALWTHVQAVCPGTWHAEAGLGGVRHREGLRTEDKLKAAALFEEALKHYQKALDINPESADLHNNAGSILICLDRVGDALTYYRQAVKLNPMLAPAQYNLASTLAKMGRDVEAIDFFKKAVQLAPKFAEAHFNLANAYVRLGMYAEAREHYRKTIQYDYGRRNTQAAVDALRQVDNRLLQAP